MPTLSKSKFISGLQCEKKLWYDFHRKDLQAFVDAQTQAVFNAGNVAGALARKIFPGGKDAAPGDYSDPAPSIKKTEQWLSEGVETIYEATFSSKNTLCMLDILHRKDGELWAIEVKNATAIKEYHLRDASLQYFVMKHAGCKPDRFFMMFINNEYVKRGGITEELFTLEEITDTVIDNESWVEVNLQAFLQIIADGCPEPEKQIGVHCSDPFACQYRHHCWSHIPENSVFELYRGGTKGWNLYGQGVLKIEDIADDFKLTHFQNLQRNGLRYQEKYIDETGIKNIISRWQLPLHFFDFETIFPMIPLLDGTRPYEQVPFLYSLHVLEEDGALLHREFLADPKDFTNGQNPLKTLVEQLKMDFGKSGNIVTYNQSFEIRILKQLAVNFPEDAGFLSSLASRVVDLLPVFQKGYCYFPEMKNSASIKSVLPAILPGLTYKDLEIQDGGTASTKFLEAVENHGFSNDAIRRDLLEYCKLDTLAMVRLYQFLNGLCSPDKTLGRSLQ